MTESFSPRLKPSAASPRVKSRTWSWYSRQVYDCQMPRSFSRMAGRAARSRAFFSRRRGSVVRSDVICSGVREAGVHRGWPEIGARRSLDYPPRETAEDVVQGGYRDTARVPIVAPGGNARSHFLAGGGATAHPGKQWSVRREPASLAARR